MATYKVKPGGMHEKFLASRNKVQIIGGGFGNGKTAASCVKGLRLAKDYPGSNGIIAMATYAQLNDTIREEFYKWIPKTWVKRWPTIANNTLEMTNGSKINFRYLKQKGKQQADGQTSSNLLSATYDWAIVDQIENPEISHKDYLDLHGRLRGSTPYRGSDPTMPANGPRWMILTCNPAFNWVYHELIKPMELYKKTGHIDPKLAFDEKTNKPIIDLFEAPTYENEHNLEKDFITSLEAVYKGQFRDRYLGGEWGAFEGLVYPSFDRKFHLIKPAVIQKYLFYMKSIRSPVQAIQGFDFGLVSPSAYLFGFLTPQGVPVIADGYYRPSKDPSYDGNEINAIQSKYSPYVDLSPAIMADPAIFKKTIIARGRAGATTIANILRDEYDLFLIPGQNDIKNGIAKVSSYLNVDNIPRVLGPIGDIEGPAIVFSEHLQFIADEFGSYFWKMGKNAERIDEPIDRNDHALDALKYMMSSLPMARELLYKKVG